MAALVSSSACSSRCWPAPIRPPAPLSAPTFKVTSNADLHAAAPLANGVCQSAPDAGACTLRAAIEKANNYPGGGVTIILPALTGGNKYVLTIDQLTITNTMTIIGGGAANTIIDGSGIALINTRVLAIYSGANATISGVTIQAGNGGAGFRRGVGVLEDHEFELVLMSKDD